MCCFVFQYEEHRKQEEERINKDGQVENMSMFYVKLYLPIIQVVTDSVYYMKQYVGNACGTVGLLHALCNNMGTLEISKRTPFIYKHFNVSCCAL